ncbi:phage portal protein [Erythrobacter sp. HA6-11]
MSFIDTLAAAFKGGGDNRVPLARGYTSPWAVALGHIGPSRSFEYGRAIREGFIANPVAQRAVKIVAEGVGSAPLSPCDKKLMQLVNATSAGQSLLETLTAQVLLNGNGYVQIIKDAKHKPIELFALRPERVRIIAGEDGWPSAYEYRVGDKRMTIELEDEAGWPNLIHIKAAHPADDHYGAGALAAADQSIGVHNAATEWNRALLENAARPSGALVFDSGDGASLTGEQFDRLKAELASAFSGENNAGRPMLLDGGLSWQSMSMSPADMDFATLKEAAARDIALAFGVPPMLLGLPGDNTYANYREANRALWRLTLLPLARKVLAGLSEGLSPWFARDQLHVDLDQVTALSEDRERLWKQVSDADFLTPEEKRAMLGLSETQAEKST